jgi:hypothetical protein
MKSRDKRGRYASEWRKAEIAFGVAIILGVFTLHMNYANAEAESKVDQVRKQFISAQAVRDNLQEEVVKNSYELQDPEKWERLMSEQEDKESLDSLTPAERTLIFKESSFNPKAKNPKSTAFGLWQGLESTRIKYGAKVGVHPNTVRPSEQIKMFRAYVTDRYGTAEEALKFHQANNYY